MTVEHVKKVLLDIPGVDTKKVVKVLKNCNFESVVSEIKTNIHLHIWDKESSINGISHTNVLSTLPHSLPDWDGLTGLIKLGDKVLHIITHDHESGTGWKKIISEEKLKELGTPLIDKIVFSEVVRYFIRKINSEGGK